MCLTLVYMDVVDDPILDPYVLVFPSHKYSIPNIQVRTPEYNIKIIKWNNVSFQNSKILGIYPKLDLTSSCYLNFNTLLHPTQRIRVWMLVSLKTKLLYNFFRNQVRLRTSINQSVYLSSMDLDFDLE